MARGLNPQAASAPLPVVSFVKVQDDVTAQPPGVHDHQARSYGYNDFSEFRRPDHYIRHIEPLESELAIQVEYDMDEQDLEWLNAVNSERKKEQLNQVTCETFEIVMDRLEKEWFDLTKNLPKLDLALPSEDSPCAICNDSEGENSNAIVFCDGCNLAVHQDCYGVPYIPEGQWLCRKCTVSPENPVTCILCPNEGGAFKQTITGEWAHLLCAIWVPETRVANDVFMEPITGVEKVSKQRWKLKCSICDIREGACIQCAKTSCFLAFHATCARKERLLMPMKNTQGSEPMTLTCYCEKHLPEEQQKAREAALDAEQSEDADGDRNAKSSKTARAYAKTYTPGPPLVPAIIVDRILQYIGKVIIRKKMDFILLMCKYWSLKREARRGAPLLKRLHLEPWTSSAGTRPQTEEDKAIKLEYLQQLRNDLEQVRRLVGMARKRESRKLKQAMIIQDVISRFFFPHEPPMRLAFERIIGFDRNDYFKNPVSKTDVPDYFDIVKNPICWNDIDSKLDRHEYWEIQKFKDDVYLVLDNAVLYNKAGTPFYKTAVRIRTHAEPILNELDYLSFSHDIPHETVNLDPSQENNNSLGSLPPIGDLEPPLYALELLTSKDGIKNDMNLILNDSPLASLFTFELGQFKPPPTPPPKKQKQKGAAKNRRKVGQENKTAPDAAAEPVSIDEPPTAVSIPRTRRAIAAAAAFEAEAHGRDPEAPLTVDDVDNQQSFKMFDAGWILPSDQKRGGRVPVDRQPLSPPKKRIRIESGMSRLSIVGTPASDDLILQKDNTRSADDAEDETRVEQGTFVTANGVTIIEELDTPAIRRAKNMRRKAEKRKLAEATSRPKSISTGGNVDMDSELSSLSETDGEAGSPIADRSMRVDFDSKDANFDPSRFPLEGGTLVWAKADTYPWWPAVIWEEDDPGIPKAVLKGGKAARRRRTEPLSLVQFYDKASSWQWLDGKRLKPLGDHKALDEDLLSTSSHQQRWKTPGVRQDCRTAYRRAVAEMETTGSDAEVVALGNDVPEIGVGVTESIAPVV